MNSIQNKIAFLILFLSFAATLIAQEDSLTIDLSKLNWKDLKESDDLSVGTKVISGSRSEKEISDLPFTIFVITAEEIRQRGYLTLTDALKGLPGIRVSQPGSALEGETFLMRGLLGNTYAKILVNDVPVKPFIASGMPIGAQLPIRNAERIEVIYGPAATLYGADASAGVINIILKESERPIYVQSDLGFGVDGFENLDVMITGKIGKNKRILKFSVFGNYTGFDDRKIKADTLFLFNPNTYQNILEPDGFTYLDRPNYRGTNGRPLLGKLPHLSNALGVDIQYRNWKFSAHRYNRRDHSSLGLSPFAVSYANPLNFFGERINSIYFQFNKTKNRFRVKTTFGTLLYETDDRSSSSYVLPLTNVIMQSSADELVEEDYQVDSIRQLIDDYYFSRSRYSSASSGEGHGDVLLGYSVNKNIELAAGAEIRGGLGKPYLPYSRDPIDSFGDTTSVQRVQSESVAYVDLSAFVEGYFNFNKWNAIVGAQVFNRGTDYLKQPKPTTVNPRLALQYKWTKDFSLRSSIGTSYRYPSPYYSAASYHINFPRFDYITTGADLNPEKTFSIEVGSRWNWGAKFKGDFSAYFTRTTDFINYTLDVNEDEEGIPEEFTLGYFNDPESLSEIYGLQSSISFTNLIPAISLGGSFNFNYANSRELFSNYSFEEQDLTLFELDEVRSQPKWIMQLDLQFKPYKKIMIILENTFMTKSYTRNMLAYQVPRLVQAGAQFTNPGFYTMDLVASYPFNKHLVGYLKFNNFFNKQYAGIDATADGDALIYNPQSGRIIRFGLNYRLD